MESFRLRAATPDDAPALVRLIDGLAEFERLAHESRPDALTLARHLAPDANPRCEAVLAEDPDGRPIGFALFFASYSTFLTAWGVYLEDLFVLPECRGRGIGKALLTRVAELAVERGAQRLDWSVLAWNADAIGFYQGLGARAMDDWRIMRLSGQALRALAGK